MSSTTRPSAQQQTVIDQLLALGIERSRAHRAVVEFNQLDYQAALDFIFSQPTDTQPVAPQPVQQRNNANNNNNNRNNSNSTNRMPQLLEAAQRVTAPNNTPAAKPATAVSSPPAMKSSEDMEVEQAIALSLQESSTPSTLSLPSSSLPSSVSADEQAAQAAIMASILSSTNQREDGVWVDPANPHQRTRRAGVPTGLKNTGNICYFNSLMQVYFHLRPTLFRAIMEVRPPQPPAPAATAGNNENMQSVYVNGRQLYIPIANNVMINENGVFIDGKLLDPDKQPACSVAQPPTPSPSVAFMLSLQRLFAGLHLSKRRYLDPIATVNALFAASGHSVKEQRMQHDASEFHDLIVETMHNALSPSTDASPSSSASTTSSSSSKSSPSSSSPSSSAAKSPLTTSPSTSVVRDMFFARAIQEVRYTDEKSTQQTLQSTSSHGPLILHIGGGSLMSALDEYTYTTLDYRASAASSPTPATQSLWFERLPTVLCFQLQRVGYDSVKKEAVKDNRFFRLDERIWMDRYVLEQRSESEAKRSEVNGWKEQRAKVEVEMKQLTDYNGSAIALNTALDGCAHYLSSLPASPLAPASHPAIAAYLSSLSGSITSTLTHLSTERERLTTLIDHAYDTMRSDNSEYRLLAVLVHDGKEAGTGHYWSYIRRTRLEQEEKSSGGGETGRFWKYNDAVVSAVDDATMWRESQGGQPNTSASAYFLVYVRRSEAEVADVDVDTLITPALREEIRKDNDKLRVETEEWDRKEEEKVVEAEAEKVRKRYVEGETQLKELDKRAEKKEVEAEEGVDWRLYSLPAFLKLHPLASLPHIQQMPQYQLLVDALSELQCAAELAGRVRERSIALLMKDGHHAASIASQRLSEADVQLVEERRHEWNEYMAVSASEVRGLMRLTDGSKHMKSALLCLLHAHSQWNAMSASRTVDKHNSKHRELSVYLQLALYLLYMSAKLRLRFSAASSSCYSDLQLVSGVSIVFPGIRPFYQQEVVMLASERDGDEQMEAVVHHFVAADMDEDEKAATTGGAAKQSDKLSALIARLEADDTCKVEAAVKAEEDKAMKREGLFAQHSRVCSVMSVKLKQSLSRVKALMAGRGEADDEKEEEVSEVQRWMVAGDASTELTKEHRAVVQEEKKDVGRTDAEMLKPEEGPDKRDGGIVGADTRAAMDDSS